MNQALRPGARLAAAAALLASASFFATASCKKEAPLTLPERPPAPVRVEASASRDVPLFIEEIGRCTAREIVNVMPQVSGPIMGIHFADGAELKRGDLLFTIDSRPFEAALAEARASLEQNRVMHDLAKIEFDRVEAILKTNNAGAVSKQDYDIKKNAVATGAARVAASEAAVETAKLNVEYSSIRSAIDGRAGQRRVDIGNVVKAEETALLDIQRLDPIYVDFTVTERELTRVREHMAKGPLAVESRIPGDAEAHTGELTFIDNAVQPSSGVVRVRATHKNEDRHFWPGQFVSVRLILRVLRGAVLVPSVAMQTSQAGPYVYVVNKDFIAELRTVKPGQRHGDWVVVEDGLTAGESVVTDGQLAVVPGGKVRIVENGGTVTRKP
jgi:multidrug efflux system membrane fusion protein